MKRRIVPRLFDCFQMFELSYTKGEEQSLSKSPGLLGQWMDTQGGGEGGGRKEGIGAGLRERTHESGSDPCNARLQTMCSLNFCSPRCGTYHFCDSQRGGACRRKEGQFQPSPLSASLFNAASIQRGGGLGVVGPGRHFTDEKSPHGNG